MAIAALNPKKQSSKPKPNNCNAAADRDGKSLNSEITAKTIYKENNETTIN